MKQQNTKTPYQMRQPSHSAQELNEQIFKEINANKVEIDRTLFRKSEHDRIELKRLKKACTNCDSF